MFNKQDTLLVFHTSSDGAVAVLLSNGLVGTGFASQYRLQPRAGFKKKAQWVGVL